jgi:nitrogenase subunit NifH
MTILLNLRGTHGSGKSYVMRKFLAMHSKQRMIYGVLGARLPEAYELTIKGCAKPVYVIGPYITVCGGLDCVRPYDNIMVLVDKYQKKGHVVFEGLIAAGVYGRVGEFLEQFKKRVHFLFLDTPLDTCIQRVKDRRNTRGTKTEFDDTNVRKKYRAVELVQQRVENEKIFKVITLSSNDAAQVMTDMLCEAT